MPLPLEKHSRERRRARGRDTGGAIFCRWLSAKDAPRAVTGTPNRTLESIMRRLILLVVLLAAVGLPSLVSAATIYRCAGPGGATVFSQVPCGKDASEVASPGSKKTQNSPAFDAIGDKAALAEIDGRCDTQKHKILDDYSARFAEANASLADLHKNLIVPGASGAEKDPAVQKEIVAVEARKTELLGSQDRELSVLRNQCQVERTAELKRETDRDSSHSVANR
jgi:hypothetical protein